MVNGNYFSFSASAKSALVLVLLSLPHSKAFAQTPAESWACPRDDGTFYRSTNKYLGCKKLNDAEFEQANNNRTVPQASKTLTSAAQISQSSSDNWVCTREDGTYFASSSNYGTHCKRVSDIELASIAQATAARRADAIAQQNNEDNLDRARQDAEQRETTMNILRQVLSLGVQHYEQKAGSGAGAQGRPSGSALLSGDDSKPTQSHGGLITTQSEDTMDGHHPEAVASHCMRANSHDSYGGFTNTCSDPVSYIHCFLNPEKDRLDTQFFSCTRPGKLWVTKTLVGQVMPGATDRTGHPVGGRTLVVACRAPYRVNNAHFDGQQLLASCTKQ